MGSSLQFFHPKSKSIHIIALNRMFPYGFCLISYLIMISFSGEFRNLIGFSQLKQCHFLHQHFFRISIQQYSFCQQKRVETTYFPSLSSKIVSVIFIPQLVELVNFRSAILIFRFEVKPSLTSYVWNKNLWTEYRVQFSILSSNQQLLLLNISKRFLNLLQSRSDIFGLMNLTRAYLRISLS